MSILICRYNRVLAYPDDDVTLSCHLSPETSAVSMEIRWFREKECIYQYKKEQVNVDKEYMGRTSLFTQELVKGNVSLVLKSVRQRDTGVYCCQVFTGQNSVEKSIRLCISGTDKRSPVSLEPTLKIMNGVQIEESVKQFELKTLLQNTEKELQDKTNELEFTNEMLKRNASLLQSKDFDLESMSKLANEKDEQIKTISTDLKMYKRELVMLRNNLQETNNQVTMPGDTDLKNLLQSRTQELENSKKTLETKMKELDRMESLLQNTNTDVQDEREGQIKMMFSELEKCKSELKILEQKLQEKNKQVQQLKGMLSDKEQQLEESLTTVNKESTNMLAYYQFFMSEILDKSGVMLNRMYQDPKKQLEDIEKWISHQSKETKTTEEQQIIARFDKEFQNRITPIQEIIEKEKEKVVVSAKWVSDLEKEYNTARTNKEKQALSEQYQEASDILKKGEAQIESLTRKMDKLSDGITERYTQEIQMIRENYETVSDTKILKTILPYVQGYFWNITANLKSFFENQEAKERQTSDHTDKNEATVMYMKETSARKESEYVMDKVINQKSEAGTSRNVTQEINNNVQTRARPVPVKKSDSKKSSKLNRWPEMVNRVIIEEDEIELEQAGELEEQE